ncbi:MAG: DUF721 domain-containing protein [Candidatus Aureabacteria bacterium]|nr:DUF721 domain-containing protein [Candidatus Auribacterota bacterium]
MRRIGKNNREKSIGDILPGVYAKLGLEERMSYVFIATSWKEIVGEVIAKHSEPTGVVGRCLIVKVDSPVWLNELNNFSKMDILKRIQVKNKKIKDIRFKIGVI